jgi:hypothetical protein
MMFVLAAMFLLTAIGASALAAAGTNRGANAEKRRENQLRLYVSGMEQTLRAARDQLTDLILYDVYSKIDKNQDEGTYREITLPAFTYELTPDLPSEWSDISFEIHVRVDMRQLGYTRYKGYVEAVYGHKLDTNGDPVEPPEFEEKEAAKPRVPEELSFHGRNTVSFDVEATLAAVGRLDAIRVRTRTVYMYHGGEMIDTQGSTSEAEPTMEISATGRGVWEFQSHERIDW